MNLVVVTGAPASGKTSIACPLAAMVGFNLLTKDMIKEALDDALGHEPTLEWSRLLGRLAYDVIWSIAGHYSRLVLEANFYPVHAERIRTLGDRPVEVFCHCPAEVAIQRYEARAATRHRVHVLESVSMEFMAQFQQPLGVGPVLRVDTTTPIDVETIARWVAEQMR
jgi:predicted kinase